MSPVGSPEMNKQGWSIILITHWRGLNGPRHFSSPMNNSPAGTRPKATPEKGFSLSELLFVITIIGIIAAIGIPRLTAAKERAHAASAVASLRSISSAEIVYNETRGEYADFDSLAESGILPDASLTSGTKSEYNFTLDVNDPPQSGYTATAEPVAPSANTPFYFLDETGVIRSAANGPATETSKPIK
jgi:prepilin-type N-terminal cleavage/methylation domain-containing protein